MGRSGGLGEGGGCGAERCGDRGSGARAGDSRPAPGGGGSHVHAGELGARDRRSSASRGVRGRRHSHTSRAHSSHPAGGLQRRDLRTQGSRRAASASTSLILRHGSAATDASEAAGARLGGGVCASRGEGGAVSSRVRSECERARGCSACGRLAGVTSLRERRWRRRCGARGEGDSAPVTCILTTGAGAVLGPGNAAGDERPLSVLLIVSVPFWEFTALVRFGEFLLGPGRLGPAPAS